MKAKIAMALIINACVAMTAIASDIYRWTDPETGKTVTTPYLPPYPIKEKRPAGGLPSGELVNVILDTDAPQVKAIIEKRKVREDEEKKLNAKREQEKVKMEQERVAQEQEEKRSANEIKWKRQKVCLSSGGAIRVGMTKEEFLACMDNQYPSNINHTTTTNEKREQWVYRGTEDRSVKNKYYYFTNGILTTIQD